MQYGLYLEVNLICSLILTIFIYRLQTSVYIKKGQRLLILSLILNILFFMSDGLWAMIDGGYINSTTEANYFINIIYFSVSGAAAFFWLLYCANIQGSILYRNKTIAGLLAIPSVALIILSINSPFTGWIFYLDSNGSYHRGDLYIVQVVIVYSYILASAIISFINSRKKSNIVFRSLYVSFGFFAVISIVGVGLQILFPGYPMTTIFITLPLLVAFLCITDSQILKDSETNLYNKRWFSYYHSSLLDPERIEDLDKGDFSRYVLAFEISNLDIIKRNHGNAVAKSVVLSFANIITNASDKSVWFSSDLQGRCSCAPIHFSDKVFVLLVEATHPEYLDSVKKYIGERISEIGRESQIPLVINVQFGQTPYDTEVEYFQDLTEIALSNMKRL